MYDYYIMTFGKSQICQKQNRSSVHRVRVM